jgi:hypothetical protein
MGCTFFNFVRSTKIRVPLRDPWLISDVKLFYSGPVINTELLVMMLEKHGVAATQEFVEPDLPEDGDLNRLARVFVPEADYDRAHRLFYAEREDEL